MLVSQRPTLNTAGLLTLLLNYLIISAWPAGYRRTGHIRAWHPVYMKRKELKPKQILSVSCPTCGVPVGKRCVLHSGGLRSEPHIDRKFAAVEVIAMK